MHLHFTPNDNLFPEASDIYRITCIANEKIYIGSAVDFRVRWINHLSELRNGIHHSISLQRAWDKYGEDTFIFEILEYILIPELLIPREQYYLDTFHPFGHRGYNISRTAGSRLGLKATPQTKEKQRQKKLNKKLSPEHVENIRKARLGQKASPESCARMSEAQRNRPPRKHKGHTPEACKKISETRLALGIKLTPEHIEKTRAANIGNQNARGYKHTDEERAKMKANNTRRVTLIVTDTNGKEYIVNGVTEFAQEHGLHHSHLLEVAQGKARQHKGWTARFPLPDEL